MVAMLLARANVHTPLMEELYSAISNSLLIKRKNKILKATYPGAKNYHRKLHAR